MYCLAKADIINEIVRTTRVDKSSALSVVEQLMTVMKDNFSSFIIKTRAEKTVRDISKKTTLIIHTHNILMFKPASSFKDEIAK